MGGAALVGVLPHDQHKGEYPNDPEGQGSCTTTMANYLCLCCVFLVALLFLPAAPLRVKGKLRYLEDGGRFVIPLARFGVKKGHSVYAFGSFPRILDGFISPHSQMTLGFVPQSVWNEFYAAVKDEDTCQDVMNTTLSDSMIVVDSTCYSGTKDYLRKVPCSPEGGKYIYCNQPNSTAIIEGHDMSYRVEAVSNTEYYYAFIVACIRNSTATCRWALSDDTSLKYDFHIVSNDPDTTLHKDPFVYEFPYELQGVLILQMTFVILYIALLTAHIILHTRLCTDKGYRMHNLIRIFTLSLVFELLHVALEMIHYSVYAHNGEGVVFLKYLGEVANQFSDWLMILVLILVGKGWQVTTSTIRWKVVTFGVWGVYILFSAVYFTWVVLQDNVYPLTLYTNHTFQSWPGGLYLTYRLVVLLYILYEMRQIYLIEMRTTALRLYMVLCGVYITWFCYLPLIVFVSAFINPLERYKVILAFILVFDCLMNLVLVLLFCPRWSSKYFQFDNFINFFPRVGSSYKSLKEYGGTGKQSVVI